MAGESKIIGEQRPIVGVSHLYTLVNAQNKPILVTKWEVRDGARVILGKPSGYFTFKTHSLGKEFTICAYHKVGLTQEQCTMLRVKPLPGPPVINIVSWLDKDFKEIKESGYFEDIFLSVQTSNIPAGDFIYVQLYNSYKPTFEHQVDKKLGNTFTMQVNENGIARANLNAVILQGLDLNNPAFSNYFVEVSYYKNIANSKSKAKKILKSKEIFLKNDIKNTKKAIKSAVVNVVDDMSKKIPVKLKINLYFDGTMGNKDNVTLFEDDLFSRVKRVPQKENKDDEVKIRITEDDEDCRWVLKENQPPQNEVLKENAEGKSEDTNSYKQTLTSIENLYTLDLSEKKKRELHIYIEGVGSIPYGEDYKISGGAIGRKQGVYAKKTKAMAKILKDTNDVMDFSLEYVEEVIVCIFGFSRGTAVARYFTSRRNEIALNTHTAEANVVFKFLGLFDTVSSIVKKTPLGESNVSEFKLKVGDRVKKVLHLTAGDEYRAKFPSTNIQSSVDAGVGYELKLPGEHSDIGGGHKNYHLVEDKQGREIPVPGIEERVALPLYVINKLIAQGWYSQTDVDKTEREYSPKSTYPSTPSEYYVARRTVWNSYRYIPLGIMIDFATKYGKITFDKKNQAKYYSVKKPLLISVKNILHNYALANDGAKSISAYEQVPQPLMKQLRHKYLHLSAAYEGGKTDFVGLLSSSGRYGNDGKPSREIIQG